MIIRSQDKKCITTDLNLYIDDYSQDGYSICNSKMDNLGEYSTEEKAIKVLDMICNEYSYLESVKLAGIEDGNHPCYVFQMPLDADVEV